MRKVLFVISTLSAMVAVSCNKEIAPAEVTSEEPEVFEVKIGMGGALSYNMSPLTKGEVSNDITAIQVFSQEVGSTSGYKPYAMGLFDDTSNISVKLMSGFTYRFKATKVVEGLIKLSSVGSTDKGPTYWAPFTGILSNAFEYDSDDYSYDYSELARGYTCGYIEGDSYTTYNRPKLDRYYGVYDDDFVPGSSASLTINMKRVVFGMKFEAEGLEDGYVELLIVDSPNETLTPDNPTVQGIYTMSGVGACITDSEHKEAVTVQARWTKDDGTVVPLGTKEIPVQLNMLTTIKVKAVDDLENAGVSLSCEATNIVEGETVTFEGSSSDDTEIETD